MPDLLIETAPRAFEPAGRYPGAVMAVQIGRKAARSGALWGLIFALFVVAKTLAYTSAYKTQAARDQLTKAFGTNIGLGALVLGVWPRRTSAVVYGYLAWSFLIEFLGAVVHASRWLLDTSVFFHMVPAPATSPDWTSATVIAGLGVAGAVIGAAFLNRRDVLTA
jgi:ABC-2 type transport system permease protein